MRCVVKNKTRILVDRIQVLNNYTSITRLSKGYSPDEKYVVLDEMENKYLLRISDMKRYDRKREEF